MMAAAEPIRAPQSKTDEPVRIGSDGSVGTAPPPEPGAVVHLDDADVLAAIEALRYVLDFGTMPGQEAPMRAALEKFERLWAWSVEHGEGRTG